MISGRQPAQRPLFNVLDIKWHRTEYILINRQETPSVVQDVPSLTYIFALVLVNMTGDGLTAWKKSCFGRHKRSWKRLLKNIQLRRRRNTDSNATSPLTPLKAAVFLRHF